MITALRRLFSSAIGKFVALAFVVLIGVGFALSDVTGNSTFGGLGGANVAQVGDTNIGLGELRDRTRRAYDQAREQQPGLTMAAFVESGGLDQVLDQLIEGAALNQYADAIGLGVSKRLVDARIADLPLFKGVTGNFDKTRFESFLRDNGISESALRQELTLGLYGEQLVTPVGRMPAVSAGLAQPYAALLLEERRGLATFIPSSRLAPKSDPGDAVLKKYLSQNASKYSIPERRVLKYAVFDRSAVPVPAVTDAEIADVYQKSKSRFAASETRRFSQVIAPDQASATSIAAKVRGGASLAAAAQTAGLSAATTDELTEAGYAAITSAAAAKSAFAAQQGAVVGPLQSSLGWTVARVETVTGKPARSLAEASTEIRAGIAKNKANEAIVDYYNAIQDAVNSGAPIDEIAADRKMVLATTPALLPSGRAPNQPAFTLEPELAPMVSQSFQGSSEGEAQLATLIENEKFAVYGVASIIPAAPPPFANLRPDLLADWQLAQGQKLARDKARAIVKAVEGGKSLADAARAEGPDVAPTQVIGGKRAELSRNGERVPPELALLFSMAPKSVKTLEIPGNRGWMVLALGEVRRPDPKSVDPKMVGAIATPLGAAFGNELAQQMIAEAKRRANVEINKSLVDQLRRELTGTAPVNE